VAGTNERLAAGKRPALPAKDYEEEEEEQGERRPQSVYDYTLLHAWLSHPVKKFKGECVPPALCFVRSKVGTIMDEGTRMTPISKCRLYWCFCLGGVAILVLNLVRENVEGQRFTRGVENTNMTDCISSL
jgi:hypothetical protein